MERPGKGSDRNGVGSNGEPLTVRRVRLDDLHADPANTNTHDELNLRTIRDSLREFGQVEPLVVHKGTNKVIGGNGRLTVMRDLGITEADVVDFDGDNVRATALGIALNRTAKTSTFDDTALSETLRALQSEDFPIEAAGFTDAEVDALLKGLADERLEGEEEPAGYSEPKAATAVDGRRPCVDVIYTFSCSDATCCVAHKSGLLYGVRSTDRACDRHPIAFIDNEFKSYDHDLHREVVAQFRPKYATVRDIMTRKQCREAGVEYYDLDQIMRWAEELEAHAENVIVIPKYDCLKDIPDRYVLGYSIPTSYGGTPMPIEAFAGRRIHLLGGSPKRQYQHWSAVPDDVVSVDTNYINMVSAHGRIDGVSFLRSTLGDDLLPDVPGSSAHLHDFGLVRLPNPFYVAFAINVGYYLALFSHRPEAPLDLDPDPDDADAAEFADAAGR
jgi:hypothetical protein